MDDVKKVLKMWFIGYVTVFVMLLFIMYLIVFKNTASTSEKHVNVSGVATINVSPDVANVSFELSTKDKTAQTAKEANDAMLKKLNGVLKKYEIKETELSMNYINIRPYYDYRRGSNELAGYVAQKTITIKIKDIEKYNNFIDDLLDIGISNINSVEFAVEDIKTVRNQARVKAVESAREKAELFASSVSKKIVDVIEISENDFNVRYSQSNYRGKQKSSMMMDVDAANGEAEMKEERGNIAVSTSVSVVFVME